VMITFVALRLLNQSFNLMTLGGLAAAVGLVIDNAIVVVENIVLHRDSGEGRSKAVANALEEITAPLVGSTITPVVVFLPLVSITGVTGAFFGAFAITMSAALFASLALALTWTPGLSQYFLRGEEGGSPESEAPQEELSAEEQARRLLEAEEKALKGIFGRVVAFYERWLRLALKSPVALVVLSIVLIIASYACYNTLGTGVLPEMDEGGFIVDYIMPAGSSLEETDRVVGHIEAMIREIPEAEGTSRRTGLQLGLAAVTEANTGDISVKLKGKRSRGIDDIIADIRKDIEQKEPGIKIEIIQLLQDMIGDLTSAPEPIQIKLFSQDHTLLETWAPRVADAIDPKKIPGVVDLLNGIDNTISGPAVVFNVDPIIAARAGFTPEEVAVDAAAILEGEPAATPLVANERAYTIRVRFPKGNRVTLDAMRNTLLVSSSGKTATLGALATLAELPGQNEIRREDLQRSVAVTARLEGVDLGRGIAAVKNAVNSLHMPANIRVVYGGTYEEQQKSFHDLVIVLILAVILVFIVLLFEFGTFAAPVAILSSALLSTSGVLVALLIKQMIDKIFSGGEGGGGIFNISSFMGLIMVIGIVAKNGILLLDADQRFRKLGFSDEEAMVQAGRRRLRPIVMTAMATVAGMLPLAFAIGAGSQMLQPLAIAVIGGIVISMVLSLIITPAVHFYLSRERSAAA
jgi:multidrug efflux pump subunit AcrB